jgi:hypothetical protein
MSDSFDIIGLDAEEENQPVNFLMNNSRGQQIGVVIDSTARDAGATPTTSLRAGLVLGRVTVTDRWKEYDDGDADGTDVARAVLLKDTNLLNAAGTAVNVSSVAHTGGFYDEDLLIGLDANGKADLKALHVLFKEDVYP